MVLDQEVVNKVDKINDLSIIEVYSEVPEVLSSDILIGKVMLWRDIQRHFGKNVRVFASCYNLDVEKYLTRLMVNYPNLYITIIPGNRREMLQIE